MFCPSCKDEFRPGFTRCEGCGVDLVEELGAVERPREVAPERPRPRSGQMVEYCGFFSLDEARRAREQLRSERLHADILIRQTDADDSAEDAGADAEEYWLRVEAAQYTRVLQVLGYDAAESDSDATRVTCGNCGGLADGDALSCPSCGAPLD